MQTDAGGTSPRVDEPPVTRLRASKLSVRYGACGDRRRRPRHLRAGDHRAHRSVGLRQEHFLRCLNRMNDLIARAHGRGQLRYHGHDLYGPSVDPVEVRRRIGMVFQKPNPFPKSIYDNVAFGPRINGSKRAGLDEVVEHALDQGRALGRGQGQAEEERASRSPAASSSGCASRAASRSKPDVILMDEPCSALDPIATARIEDLMAELKREYTIVIVTHNMQQAARVSDMTAFMTTEVVDEAAAPAGWSSTTAPRRCSPTRPTLAPRVTSPVGSGDGPGARAARSVRSCCSSSCS